MILQGPLLTNPHASEQELAACWTWMERRGKKTWNIPLVKENQTIQLLCKDAQCVAEQSCYNLSLLMPLSVMKSPWDNQNLSTSSCQTLWSDAEECSKVKIWMAQNAYCTKPLTLPLPPIRWRHSAKPDWANDQHWGRVPPLHCLCAQTSIFLEPWEAAALFPGVLRQLFLHVWTEIPKRTGVSAHDTTRVWWCMWICRSCSL